MSKKNDPLASAKVNADGVPASLPASDPVGASSAAAESPERSEGAAASLSPDQLSPPSSDANAEPEADLAPPVLPTPVPTERVVRKITISWGGQMITLNPGDLVSDASYGPRSRERMRECGVALELVE